MKMSGMVYDWTKIRFQAKIYQIGVNPEKEYPIVQA